MCNKRSAREYHIFDSLFISINDWKEINFIIFCFQMRLWTENCFKHYLLRVDETHATLKKWQFVWSKFYLRNLHRRLKLMLFSNNDFDLNGLFQSSSACYSDHTSNTLLGEFENSTVHRVWAIRNKRPRSWGEQFNFNHSSQSDLFITRKLILLRTAEVIILVLLSLTIVPFGYLINPSILTTILFEG